MKERELKQSMTRVLSGIAKGDVVATESVSVPVAFEMDRLKSVENSSRFAIGLRMFENGHVGNSYINSLNDEQSLIDNARSSAMLGDVQDFELPSQKPQKKLNFYFPEVLNISKKQMIQTGEELVERLKKIDSRAKVDVNISRSVSRFLFGNTQGLFEEELNTSYHVSASMVLVHDDGSLLYVGEGDGCYNGAFSIENIIEKIHWRYEHALQEATLKSGYYPVIFAPDAVSLLLSPLRIAANGKTLYRGTSVLQDRIGETITDTRLTLTDHPYLEDGFGSYTLDDEGVIPSVLPIVENGIFKNFIHDLSTAAKLYTESTGHASRGIASLPSPSYSNLVLSIGQTSLVDMIAGIDEGLFVCETLGGGMSNLTAGDISVNVELGYVIRKGKLVGRVKDTMISGNVYNWYKKIGGIENKVERLGSAYYPHLLIDAVSVSSKGG